MLSFSVNIELYVVEVSKTKRTVLRRLFYIEEGLETPRRLRPIEMTFLVDTERDTLASLNA